MFDLQKKLDEIIKEVITPIMKKEGFKKQGRNYFKDMGAFGLCLNIQSSRYNDVEEVSFTINTSVVLPQEYLDFHGEKLSDFPKEYEGIIRKRAADIIGEKNDRWYVITKQTDLDELKSLLASHFGNHIMPYFQGFNNIDDLLQILNELPSKTHSQEDVIAAGFITSHGDFDMGRKRLLDMVKRIDKDNYAYFYEKLLNYCVKLGINAEID